MHPGVTDPLLRGASIGAVDTTGWVRGLFEDVPVHQTLGLEVVQAKLGAAEVRAEVTQPLANVVGAMHSSGVVALVDASGLAAVLSWCADPAALDGVTPLGRATSVRFHAPGRGRLSATTRLCDEQAAPAVAFFEDTSSDRARVETLTTVRDEAGLRIAEGSFVWHLARRAPT